MSLTFSLLVPIVQAMTVVVRDYTQYEVVEEEVLPRDLAGGVVTGTGPQPHR